MRRLTIKRKKGVFQVTVIACVDLMMSTAGFANGSWTITQVSSTTTNNTSPAVSGTNVVWDAPGEIYSNFAGHLANRTSPWGFGSDVDVSGSRVVWQDYDGADWEIYTNFAGQLTNNSNPDGGLVEDRRPAISGTSVVWENNGGIESNFAGHIADSLWSWEPSWPKGHYPDVSGTNVVWQDRAGNGWQIYSNFAGQLTNDSFDHVHPAISGTNVVWETSLGDIESNFAGHLADIQTAPLNLWPPVPRSYPAISGTNVVWASWDGSNYEIYSNFAGQLTNNTFDNLYPDISGTNVVWQGWDGSDWEIYMATYGEAQVVPLPGAVLLGIFGLGTASQKLRKCV